MSNQFSDIFVKRKSSDLRPVCGLLRMIRAMSLAYFLWCQQELSVLIYMLNVYRHSKKSCMGWGDTPPGIICIITNGYVWVCKRVAGILRLWRLSPFLSSFLLLPLPLHLSLSPPSLGGFVLTEAVCAPALAAVGRGAVKTDTEQEWKAGSASRRAH